MIHRNRVTTALALFFLVAGLAAPLPRVEGATAEAPGALGGDHPSFVKVDDVPGLPRILLLGDSISMGYTLAVRDALKGVANVHRPPVNCGSTVLGLRHLEEWMGNGQWHVIHFNWGLHDLRYLPTRVQATPLEEYGRNLRQLIERMKKTDAVLIFATTTPVREDYYRRGNLLRRAGDEKAYNATAVRVMKEHGVIINDLHAVAAPRVDELQIPGDLHFTAEGSEELARAVAGAIRRVLTKISALPPDGKDKD
jgi:acyl-CoA thioesterase-1